MTVLILFACIFTLPTAAMIGTAFKGDTRALSDTGLFPARPELTAFRAVLQSDFPAFSLKQSENRTDCYMPVHYSGCPGRVCLIAV
ncbi:MAG: hypothetical protein ACLTCQ_15930 [Enterocloster bolteae]